MIRICLVLVFTNILLGMDVSSLRFVKNSLHEIIQRISLVVISRFAILRLFKCKQFFDRNLWHHFLPKSPVIPHLTRFFRLSRMLFCEADIFNNSLRTLLSRVWLYFVKIFIVKIVLIELKPDHEGLLQQKPDVPPWWAWRRRCARHTWDRLILTPEAEEGAWRTCSAPSHGWHGNAPPAWRRPFRESFRPVISKMTSHTCKMSKS